MIDNFPTKEPMVLYWRDGLELIAQLFANPVFSKSMGYDAYKLIDPLTGYRVYGDFLSAEYAWNYQVYFGTYDCVVLSLTLVHRTRNGSPQEPPCLA